MSNLYRSLLAAAVVAVIAVPAHALEIARASAPRDVSPTDVQAQAWQADPCAHAVQIMQHDKWLSVKRGVETNLRDGAKVQLAFAGQAASRGNEGECWKRFGLAEENSAP